MFKKIVQIVAVLAVVFAPTIMLSTSAYAADPTSSTGCGNNELAKGIADGATSTTKSGTLVNCSDTGADGETTIKKVGRAVVNIITLVVGIVSVIMIIVGGFKYITSGGDSNRVGSAKNTIVYAVIGLIIVAVAQIIVRFVLSTTTDAVK